MPGYRAATRRPRPRAARRRARRWRTPRPAPTAGDARARGTTCDGRTADRIVRDRPRSPEPPASPRLPNARRDATAVLEARWSVRHRLEQLLVAVTGERKHAVERVVERDAEAELVALAIRDRAADLLGRHVARRPHDRPGLGQ